MAYSKARNFIKSTEQVHVKKLDTEYFSECLFEATKRHFEVARDNKGIFHLMGK